MLLASNKIFQLFNLKKTCLAYYCTKNNKLGKIIDTTTLNSIITNDKKDDGIKILDCTYVNEVKPNPEKFMNDEYGKFDDLIKKESPHKTMYMEAHIPTASLFDINCAMYPGKFERFSFYPENEFEKYIQKLGINKDDHLILYGRGVFGGNMFAARCLRLLQYYGQENISLLNGGLGKWINDGYQVVSGNELPKTEGNWKSKKGLKDMLITFDDLIVKDKDGKTIFDKAGDEYTFLDSRPHDQFVASFIDGSNNLPVSKLLNKDGTIADKKEILTLLKDLKIDTTKPIISYCNTGTQASLVSFIFEYLLGLKTKLYNGSLTELSEKDPARITSF
ncbi:Sulfurtransferase [Strongyloides ratti]|uniref:Sulfurtransferase n=1 Tax=Strongyloides ratti TaxID=34506 RepID=A0A090N0E2_STRRB|nr:Sulfurtransferase [Strongyloides ratti]CEF70532.1 Sulfurtransferase [Strongyloides ratti]